MIGRLVVVACLCMSATVAYADCYYNGHKYAEGSKLGPYTCVNGEWR